MFVRGKEIPPPVHGTIVLFSLCQAFEFKHLPVAGGLYDQHPVLLERFGYILGEQAKEQKRKDAEEKAKQRNTMGTRRARKPSSRR